MNRPNPRHKHNARARYDNLRKPNPPRPRPSAGSPFNIVERTPPPEIAPQNMPFRIVIAIHRPRFRSRAERGAARVGWEVTALLNKQDPVGLCMKAPRPPDILVLSGDFGRQKDYAIFRAVQASRAKGMIVVGLVEDSETAPEKFPDSAPKDVCDICITYPYNTADFRDLFAKIYTEIRKKAPPLLLAEANKTAVEEGDDDTEFEN